LQYILQLSSASNIFNNFRRAPKCAIAGGNTILRKKCSIFVCSSTVQSQGLCCSHVGGRIVINSINLFLRRKKHDLMKFK